MWATLIPRGPRLSLEREHRAAPPPSLEWRSLLRPRTPIPNPRSLLPYTLSQFVFSRIALLNLLIHSVLLWRAAAPSWWRRASSAGSCWERRCSRSTSAAPSPFHPRPVRVYMDGCFDMMHYGHCNALRQAHALGDELIVGVVSDDEITANKGPPVTPLHERLVMVRAVKWVHDVIPDAPYAITEEFMNKLFNEYNIDYIIHGDDPCLLPDGTDAYALAKKAGRYKQIKRTEGVSTTDIVGRMLLCVRERSASDSHNHSSLQRQFSHGHGQKIDESGSGSGTRISHFLPTSRRIVQFSNSRGPGPDSRIVYIDGAFDLFHAGHVEILRLARELGDFLLVGIHTDQTISSTRGPHRPIMNLHERSLSVLACRYVDEVIIGSPWDVSKDMITTFNISLVVHGTIAENMDFMKDDLNPYAVPRAMGIYHKLESPLDITTSTIIRRIVANHEAYQKRNEKKEASEKKHYDSKSFVNVE